MSGEQKAVEDIEALGIGRAIGPCLDVAGTQELRLVDSGDWAPPAPIIDEALTKNILTDPLDDKPLGLRIASQARDLFLKIKQRFRRKRKSQTVEAIDQRVERGGFYHREGPHGA